MSLVNDIVDAVYAAKSQVPYAVIPSEVFMDECMTNAKAVCQPEVGPTRTLAPGVYSREYLKEYYGDDYDKTFAPLESDPTGRTAKDPGAKLDQGKIMGGLLADFSLALTAVAEVGTYGANKYTRCGWESVPNGITRYGDAKWRHLLKGATAPIDHESGLMHKAHEAWNVLAELELLLREKKATL